MHSVIQALDEISRLVDALPGINVLGRRIDGHNATIEVRSRGAKAAHLLQGLCGAANVALEPPLLFRDPEFNSEVDRHFSLIANIGEFDLIEFGNLQLLGIHLVWHLHSAGKMPTEVANEYLQRWNGARVGA